MCVRMHWIWIRSCLRVYMYNPRTHYARTRLILSMHECSQINSNNSSMIMKTEDIPMSNVFNLPILNGSISTQSDIRASCASVSPSKRGTFPSASVITTPWGRKRVCVWERWWVSECIVIVAVKVSIAITIRVRVRVRVRDIGDSEGEDEGLHEGKGKGEWEGEWEMKAKEKKRVKVKMKGLCNHNPL